jgi:hypothetical protein
VAHFVYGSRGVSHDVKLVERDASLGNGIGDTLDEGRRHINAGRRDLAGIATISGQVMGERRQDIEQILTTITGREGNPADKPQGESELAIIPNGYSGARPGSSPFAFQTSQNRQQALLPITYFVKTSAEDLRINRWFHHQ